jgi:FkbM family methyltransferase
VDARIGIFTKFRNVVHNYREVMRNVKPRWKAARALTESYWNYLMNRTSKHAKTNLVFTTPWGKKLALRTGLIREALGMIQTTSGGIYLPSVKLREKPVIFDCGANIGVVTAHYAHVYPGAEVHAFEASKRIVGLLRENVGALPGVHVMHAAVSNASGEATLNRFRWGSLGSSLYATKDKKIVATEKTRKMTLEEYLGWKENARIARIDLLKLNVESSEFDALQGLGERISDVGVIVGEIHEKVDANEVKRYLKEKGFRISRWTPTTPGKYLFEALNERMYPEKR